MRKRASASGRSAFSLGEKGLRPAPEAFNLPHRKKSYFFSFLDTPFIFHHRLYHYDSTGIKTLA